MSTSSISGLHHVAIRVADFDRAVEFYQQGLGFSVKGAWGEDSGRGALLDAGNGNYVEIFAGGADGERPQGVCEHIAFRCSDVDGTVKQAVAAGATVTVEPKEVTIPSEPTPIPVRLAFCRTPTGEIVEFFDNAVT